MWRFVLLEFGHDGISIISFSNKPWNYPWILLGIFKYKVHMGSEPEWTLGLFGFYINIKWLWDQLKKKRTLRL